MLTVVFICTYGQKQLAGSPVFSETAVCCNSCCACSCSRSGVFIPLLTASTPAVGASSALGSTLPSLRLPFSSALDEAAEPSTAASVMVVLSDGAKVDAASSAPLTGRTRRLPCARALCWQLNIAGPGLLWTRTEQRPQTTAGGQTELLSPPSRGLQSTPGLSHAVCSHRPFLKILRIRPACKGASLLEE